MAIQLEIRGDRQVELIYEFTPLTFSSAGIVQFPPVSGRRWMRIAFPLTVVRDGITTGEPINITWHEVKGNPNVDCEIKGTLHSYTVDQLQVEIHAIHFKTSYTFHGLEDE